MMFPVLEHKILKDRQFLCGNEMTPVDYMLSCELNTTILMLDKHIDEEKFPHLAEWRQALNSISELVHTREQYSKRLKNLRKLVESEV